jgi:hypothetical protein
MARRKRSDPKPIVVDLRRVRLDEWIEFVFAKPASRGKLGSGAWYWKKDYRLRVDPSRQIEMMTDLFRRSASLLRRFSEGQIEDGFWFIIGPAGEDWFKDQLWNRNVAWSLRKKCIASIPRLYSGAFRTQFGSMPFMLWDLLTEDYWLSFRSRRRGREAQRVRRAMLRALAEQLDLPSVIAQKSAIHGLGHIGLPGARSRLKVYLRRPRLHGWLRPYAQEALTTKKMH